MSSLEGNHGEMMMKKMQFVCVMLVIATAGISQAAVTINELGTSPQEITAIQPYATGSSMAGMTVSFNGAAAVTWVAGIGDAGSATDGGFSLSVDGATGIGTLWSLTATAGSNTILVDAGAGDAVFDIVEGVVVNNTTGSLGGYQFTETVPSSWTVDYSGPVSLQGESFQGDLYRYMLITTDAGWAGGTATFQADTDHVSDISAVVVPAPGAMLLAGLGSSLVGFFRRRQWA